MKFVTTLTLAIILTSGFRGLAIAQTETLSDLEVRREAFLNALSLSVEELKSISDSLGQFKNFTKTEEAFKNKLLSDSVNFLSIYQGLIEIALSENDVESLKNKVQDFKEWRESFYLPWLQRASDFILISRNANVLNIAKARLQKIAADLDKLENAGLDTTELRESLRQAQLFITEANDFQVRAHDAFWSDLRYNLNKPTVKDLVGISLERIRSAYQVFFEMSNLVRKLLN